MFSLKGIVLTYISPIVHKAVKMIFLRWERDTANWYSYMLFSKQLHWICYLIRSFSTVLIEWNFEIGGCRHSKFRMSMLESKHAYSSYQVVRAVVTWKRAVTKSNRSEDLIRWISMIRLGHGCSKFRMVASAEFEILLNQYCWKWLKFSEIACWKAWHYSSRKNINIRICHTDNTCTEKYDGITHFVWITQYTTLISRCDA